MSDQAPMDDLQGTDESPAPVSSGSETKTLLSNNMYDRLKFVAQILLPGVGALYFALAQIWGFPKAEEVVGTITALDVFLGLFLARASARYDESEEWVDAYVDAEDLPPAAAGQDRLILKVKNSDS